MTRTRLIVLAAALQVAVIGYMIAGREWVVHAGREVWLRTAPVDPRDYFRGDYVRLAYPFSRVAKAQCRDMAAWTNLNETRPGKLVYAAFSLPAPDAPARFEYLSGHKPDAALCIRGRTERSWGSALNVRYGLEAYFVEQGQGLVMEQNRQRDGIQVPLDMRVAVGGNGVAVLTGFRWCELGIGLTVENTTNQPAQTRAVTVKIANVSTQVWAVVRQPGWTFTLENDSRNQPDGAQVWTWVGPSGSRPILADTDIVMLEPGQELSQRFDFADPAWFGRRPGSDPRPLAELERTGGMFRIRYLAPPAEACRNLQQASRIWHGELMSRAFGAGRVD